IDGIFVARDNMVYMENSPLLDELDLIQYTAPGGELFLRKNRYIRYGYDLEDDFIHDCTHGLVECKTVPGVVTLGPLRRLPGKPIYVYLYGTGLNAAPVFLADSPAQAR